MTKFRRVGQAFLKTGLGITRSKSSPCSLITTRSSVSPFTEVLLIVISSILLLLQPGIGRMLESNRC